MAGYEKNHGISRDFIWFQLCSHRLQQVWIEWFTQGFLAFPDFPDFTQLQLGQELRVLNVGRWQTDSGHLMEMVKDAYKRGRLGTWGTWGISCGILPWWWWWWWWFKVPSFCFSWRSALSGIRKQFADTRWLLLENIELESDIHLPLDCFLTSILETLAASHLFDLILFGRQLQSLSTLYQFRSKHWRSRNKSQQVVISSCVPCHSMSFHVGVQQRSQVLSPWSSRRPRRDLNTLIARRAVPFQVIWDSRFFTDLRRSCSIFLQQSSRRIMANYMEKNMISHPYLWKDRQSFATSQKHLFPVFFFANEFNHQW